MTINRNLFFLLAFFAVISVNAQNKVSQKIMEMGRNDNRTMEHLDILANRIGGRPIGSDAYANATY